MTEKIKCPKCDHEFGLSDVLSKTVDDETKKQIAAEKKIFEKHGRSVMVPIKCCVG